MDRLTNCYCRGVARHYTSSNKGERKQKKKIRRREENEMRIENWKETEQRRRRLRLGHPREKQGKIKRRKDK